jgi:hypothetical protein
MKFIINTLFFALITTQAITMVAQNPCKMQEVKQESKLEKAKRIGKTIGVLALKTAGIAIVSAGIIYGIKRCVERFKNGARISKLFQDTKDELNVAQKFLQSEELNYNGQTLFLKTDQVYLNELAAATQSLSVDESLQKLILDDLNGVLQGTANSYNEFFEHTAFIQSKSYFARIKDIFDAAVSRNEFIAQLDHFNKNHKYVTLDPEFASYPPRGSVKISDNLEINILKGDIDVKLKGK